jgi:hypothetical protein
MTVDEMTAEEIIRNEMIVDYFMTVNEIPVK